MARLQRLAALNEHVRRSSFQENQRAEIAARLDRIACDIEARCKLFESIDAKPVNHVDKAVTILRLITAGSFTEGQLSARARELVVSYLSKPGFLTGYVAQAAKSGEGAANADAAVAELMQTLQKLRKHWKR